MHPAIDLAIELCRCRSITPSDDGCQTIIKNLLSKQDFTCQSLSYNSVQNLWATHCAGTNSSHDNSYDQPLLLFVGHTDVVPPGDENLWHTPPFEPTIKDDVFYARGIADMKGSVAAFCSAARQFVSEQPNHKGTIAIALTSDEEGPAIDGIQRLCKDFIKMNNIAIDYCLVGEPSSEKNSGDTIKIGRRGSLTAHLTIMGQQGHIAYPENAKNPINNALSVLNQIKNIPWKEDPYFPKTNVQFANINSGLGIDNVIPEVLQCSFNFRYGSVYRYEEIQQKVEQILKASHLKYKIEWFVSALPYLSNANEKFVQTVSSVVEKTYGKKPKFSTGGGTSDGRFIAEISNQVIEFGPMNSTIHQINESLTVIELEQLYSFYLQLLYELFGNLKP